MTHPPEHRCWYCATDEDVALAFAGHLDTTLHMEATRAQCPRLRRVTVRRVVTVATVGEVL